ncbi:MAG: non-homologous end-joining DNA ligase, partial [Bdellovibrionota bacterium]
MALRKYFAKRDFQKTPEPRGKIGNPGKALIYVIQEHHASHLHYDFRLESGGTLKSWAVPKGPSLDPKVKRLAVEVEDHPISYAKFEGDIPKGEYGGGNVVVWDYGSWIPSGNVNSALKKGHLDFELQGEKLQGKWTLIRTRITGSKPSWLLFKRNDEFARSGSDVLAEMPGSVLSAVEYKKKAITAPKPKKQALPAFIKPQLAELVQEAPAGAEWIHEIKYDGYRTQCRLQKGQVKLLTRSGLDWTPKYPLIAKEALRLKVKDAILDGEIVWLDELGHSNFQGLQNALSEKNHERLVYYVFDILHLNGEDLRDLPLLDRKAILEELIGKKNSKLIYSEHWKSAGRKVYSEACRMQLEGIVSKRADAVYSSGRDSTWQKTKCALRQEMVIGG